MDRQRALLHQGGSAGHWGSLGLWPGGEAAARRALATAPLADVRDVPLDTDCTHDTDYATACHALAQAVGRAAGIAPGQRVLSIACGAGEELRLWADGFGAGQVLGVEADPRAAAQARVLADRARSPGPAIQVLCRSATALARTDDPALADPFDAIVCVDAAYHLSPRRGWLQAMHALLRPGGRLAYTDLVLSGPRSPLLAAAARLCGVPAGDLAGLPAQLQRLRDCGFAPAQAQRLDEAVLGGFTRFARRQEQALGLRPWQAGWRGVATTARLIPPGRAAGLGYALLWATRPAGAAPGA